MVVSAGSSRDYLIFLLTSGGFREKMVFARIAGPIFDELSATANDGKEAPMTMYLQITLSAVGASQTANRRPREGCPSQV